MVSKLGFFFWHKLFAIYYTLSGARLVGTQLLMQNLSQALSTSTGATSQALKWLAKKIVGKVTIKKPRSNVVLAVSMQYASANIGQSRVVAMVRLFVSLQGGRTI
jgi:hypothetical protein